jgi:hypothetical protein
MSAPSPPISKLSLFLSLHVCYRCSLLTGEGEGGGGRGAESYGRKKAGPSINLQSSLPTVMQIRGDTLKNLCSLKKSHTAKDRAQAVVVKFYGDKLSKITQIYRRNTLLQYFVFCTAFSGYKDFKILYLWEYFCMRYKKYQRPT